ncbi:MAG TPA: tRNA epoxyqueuosine(34) reductase QueG [Stellaceae bacterium]|nr:tRNA epoxyqueuosine(34) reductase QueG [Stellaceae bacterium]
MSDAREGIKAAIRREALALGFDAVGFAPAALAPEARAGLADFIARGYHGDMGWLAARGDERASPDALWGDARSVVVLGLNYTPEDDPLALIDAPERGNISVYARGRDYHDLVKSRLKRLAGFIAGRWPGALKLFVDTAPVMEKPLAARAGLGWQGKHTNLVSRDFGSWLFLGEIYLSLELPPDEAHEDRCGTCRNCLDACPTAAFPAPYRLDARRCISYLTIEHKGHIEAELRPLIGNRIYGCDDCLAVCPWNKFAQVATLPGLAPRNALTAPALDALASLDDAAFRALFSGSPVKRVGRDRFVRNVLIAIGNSGARHLLPAAAARLDDKSPLVRAMAVWAVRRLADDAEVEALGARHRAGETDADVRAEWAR